MKICKRFNAIILVFAILFSMLQAVAFAENSIEAVYGSNGNIVDIKGTFSSKVNASVSLTVLPKGLNVKTLTPSVINENKYPMRQIKCGENGAFSAEIGMPESFASGVYIVKAVSGTETVSCEFSYVASSDLNNIIGAVNSANTSSLPQILTDNATLLGLSANDTKYAADIAKYLYTDKPNGGFNTGNFFESLSRCVALAHVKNGEVSVITAYDTYFGIDVSDMTAQELAVIPQILASEADAGSKELLNRCILTAKMQFISSYAQLDGIIKAYGSNAGMDLSVYSAMSSTKCNSVLKSVYEQLPNNFNDFNTLFARIVAEEFAKTDCVSSGSSSGSSFSGFEPAVNQTENSNNNLQNNDFADMDGHWAKDYAKKLKNKGIISGRENNMFCPDDNVTRAEFVKMLLAAIGGKTSNIVYFSDCAETDWFFTYVSGAKEAGIVYGNGTEFNPMENITRQDAAVMIYRVLNTSETAEASFGDTTEISDYARDAVGYLSKLGIINGSDGNFMPKNNATRAEAAVMICNMLDGKSSIGTQDKQTAAADEAYGLISAISRSDEYMPYSAENCTRGAFLSAALSVAGVDHNAQSGAEFSDLSPGTEIYGYASYAVNNGIINDGEKLRPDDDISYEEAAQITLNTFGYGVAADSSSYLETASQVKLFRGVNTADGISYAEAYKILYNMLKAKDIETGFAGEKMTYKQSENDILLNHYNIKEVKGVMTANEYTDLNDISASGGSIFDREGKIAVDGNDYYVSTSDYNSLIGCGVTAYVRVDKDLDREEAVFVYADKNEIIELNSYELRHDNGYIYDTSVNKKYKISKSFSAVVNGKLDTSFGLDNLDNVVGTVKLIYNDNSSACEVLIVTDVKYVKVASFNRQSMIISGANANDTQLIIPEDAKISVSSSDGENAELADISAGAYIAYAASKDRELVDIVILNSTIDGTAKRIVEDTKLVIDDTEYYMSSYFTGNSLNDLTMGVTGTYLAGLFGDIVAADGYEMMLKYGYLISAKNDDYENRLIIRMFTQDGEMLKVETADEVKIDGVKQKDLESVLQNSMANPTVVKYALDGDNRISVLDLPETMNFFKDSGKADLDVYNGLTRNIVGDAEDRYYYMSGTMYPSITTEEAIVFRIPKNKDMYENYDIGFSFDEGYLSDGTDIEVYDAGMDGKAKVLCAFVDDNASVYVNSPSMVVEKVIESVDEEGAVRKLVSSWSDGKFAEYYLAENISIEKKKKQGELEFGDIIRFHAIGNEIKAMYVDFIGKDFMMNYITGSGLANFNSRTTNYQYRAGGVYSVVNGSALIAKLAKVNNNDAEQRIDYNYTPDGFVRVNIPSQVICADSAEKKISVTDANAINTYLNSDNPSKVVIKTYRSSATYCVI